MVDNFNFKLTEEYWQNTWYSNNIYKAQDNDSSREKKYILTEFPFPSGASLHVGHVFRYTVPDVYSRYLRMKGFNVLFPMGYDAFGLPTEERARKDGKNPTVTTEQNIASIRKNLQQMGYSFDWDREFSTTDPEYYKWTQWIFGEMFKAGLVKQQEVELWWCPKLSTVLSNEEVIDDPKGSGVKVSERGDHPVEKRKMSQWIIKITEYAEKLLEGLDTVQWPEYIKEMQRNWIGKSVGCEVKWGIEDSDVLLKTFTTRVDTLPAVSFVALAPESDLISKIVSEEQKQKVVDYITLVKGKSERDRQIGKDKTGIFTGSFAVNPLTGQKVEIWVADYVLSGYGTGIVMGVAGHDERDYQFAIEMGLPIRYNIKPKSSNEDLAKDCAYLGDGVLFNSGEFDGVRWQIAKDQITLKAEKENWGESKINYKFRDWVFSRQRYWGEPFPFEYLKVNNSTSLDQTVTEVDGEKYFVTLLPVDKLPLELPKVDDYEPSNDGQSPLAKTDWIDIKDKSGSVIGKHESDTMPNWAGSSWYYLRYTDPKNNFEFASQQNLKYWLPVDHYFGGSEHTTLHLLYSRFWHRFLYDQGHVPTAEPYFKRTNGGILLAEDGTKMSKSKGNVINPAEKVEEVGSDALRLYINFIGPYNATVAWQEGGLKACKKLVDSIWGLQFSVSKKADDTKLVSAYHKMIRNINNNIENLKTNVAIAEIMTFTNLLKEVESIPSNIWSGFIRVIAPFAPHITEELWYAFNNFDKKDCSKSIHLSAWPDFDPELCVDSMVTIAVQVNGKIRAEFDINRDSDDEIVLAKAKDSVKKWLVDKEEKFIKVVKNKLVTIAVK